MMRLTVYRNWFFLVRLLTALAFLLPAPFSRAQDPGIGKSYTNKLSGADATLTVGANAALTYTKDAAEQGAVITNIIRLQINEESGVFIPGDFSATVSVSIAYGESQSATQTINQELTVTYHPQGGVSYNAKNYLSFHGAKYVNVVITGLPTMTALSNGVNPLTLLVVENEMLVRRLYELQSPTLQPSTILATPLSGAITPDVLPVSWEWPAGAGNNRTQLEWAWVEDEMAANYQKSNGTTDFNLLFRNNATRVELPLDVVGYEIPLLYDGQGKLYYRLRAVNIKATGSMSVSAWSDIQSYTFSGHDNTLNWQAATSFAEEGKRKSVMQYYDGSFRMRQTVTKDNSTNTIVSAETFYDGQGRPAIQVLPAPTMSNILAYTQDLNRFNGQSKGDDPALSFDLQAISGGNSATLDLRTDRGAAQYYSASNPTLPTSAIDQNLPDAKGYPYTVTRYTPDATGRIMSQSGVGDAMKMGSGHETKYFYGNAAAEELDALFGTEAGDVSHYFKNMVQDANGQMSISYVDMHGRTIATALAGDAPTGMTALVPDETNYPGQSGSSLTRNLLNKNINVTRGNSVEALTSILVPYNTIYNFTYALTPAALKLANCDHTDSLCYGCKYDLEISITDESGDQDPIVRRFTNVSLAGGDTCSSPFTDEHYGGNISTTAANIVTFSETLKAGSYSIRKTLTISDSTLQAYEDKFLQYGLCKSKQDLIDSIYSVLQAASGCGTSGITTACQSCLSSLGTYDAFKAAYIVNMGSDIPTEVALHAIYSSDSARCAMMCSSSSHSLSALRSIMLADMMPGSGQYAKSPAPAMTNTSYTAYDILATSHNYYRSPLNSSGAAGYYHDELGNTDVSIHPDATNPYLYLNSIDASAFTGLFKNAWADAILPHHPEYNKLVYAEQHLASAYDWIDNLVGASTWANSISGGYNSSTGHPENTDPFFTVAPSSYKTVITSYETTASYYGGMSMWQIAYGQVSCSGNTTDAGRKACYLALPVLPSFSTLSTTVQDAVWNNFKALYKNVRDSLVNVYLQAQSAVSSADQLVTDGYELRFPFKNSQLATEYNASAMLSGNTATIRTALSASTASHASTVCSSYIDRWRIALSQCPSLAGRSDSLEILNEIVSGMEKVCEYGLDDANPQGSSNVAPSTPAGYYTDASLGSITSPRSFEDVVKSVFLKYTIDPSQYCNPFVIDYPKPYGKGPQLTKEYIGAIDTCTCSQYSKVKYSAGVLGYDTTNYDAMNLYLKNAGLDTLTQVVFDGLGHCPELGIKVTLIYDSSVTIACSTSNPCGSDSAVFVSASNHFSQCTYNCEIVHLDTSSYYALPTPQPKPDFLYCGFTPVSHCLSCSQLSALITSYKAYFSGQACSAAPVLASADDLTDDQITYNQTFALYVNYVTGFQYTWIDYTKAALAANCSLSAYSTNNNALQNVICADTTTLTDTTGIFVAESPCQRAYDEALALAESIYPLRKEQLLANFEAAYKAKCLAAANLETFTVQYIEKEYHYTLYYYDMAGNLERTVPPKGARPDFSSSFIASVEAAKTAGTLLRPGHVFVTTYRYNSLNEVVTQNTPDAGSSSFWYDKLGRLAVSQNARQALDGSNTYSYTLYDLIGRITEVGQKSHTTPMTQTISQVPADLDSWIHNTGGVRSQITSTVYDVKSPFDLGGLLSQDNLRNRVSYTNTYNQSTDGNWYTATFYTYDVHGNVDTLLQDYAGVPSMASSNRYKRIAYDYDLISGKVNGVDYQPGAADAFYHRYQYDAENRLVKAFSSRDSLTWERDAAYSYYKHGPLSRTVLGKLQVQGIDYAYTLQGWLKHVNMGNSGSGVVDNSGASCAAGTALNDVEVSTRAASSGPATYTARSVITFGTGFSVGAGDTFDAVINSGLGVCTTDAGGGTGVTDATEYAPVARDAYSFGLHYYPGDYTAVGSTVSTTDILGALPATEAAPLYNGNISAMAVNINVLNNPLVYNYHYDQLNRIRQMDAYSGWNTVTNLFTPVKLDDYQERVAYDPNGNIQTYVRHGTQTGGQPIAMDSLTYGYYDNTNQLKHIADGVSATNYSVDIDCQTVAENYTYDQIGNLKTDAASGITNIDWTVYGKIASITNASGTISYTYDAGGNRITKTAGGVTTIYVRDAQGNVMSVYRDAASVLKQTEVDLYGSSRLGLVGALTVAPTTVTLSGGYGTAMLSTFTRGEKTYELGNHLGNVLATISDRKIGVSSDGSSLIDHYTADVLTAQDYYPFGMQMPGRNYTEGGAGSYRYGFNGKENDNEVKGVGDQIDYGMRVYDPRVGKFLSVDPLFRNFAWNSVYAYAENDVLRNIDLDGGEKKHYLLVWDEKHGDATLTYSHAEDFTETKTKWTPTWSNWTKRTTTTVKNPRIEYVVHGTVAVPMSADGMFKDDIRAATWTFTTAEEMFGKENARREHLAKGPGAWGPSHEWGYASSDQHWDIALGQMATYGVEAQATKEIYSPNVFKVNSVGRKIMYHYTTEEGENGIISSQSLKASIKSLNPGDARYGDGQYLTDIVPGTKTPGQLSRAFLRLPWLGKRFTNYVAIDVTGLNVVKGRENVFVILNSGNLDLRGRIVGSGQVPAATTTSKVVSQTNTH